MSCILRPHRSTTYVDAGMRPIVTDRVAWSVCLFVEPCIIATVCRSVTIVNPAKTAEPMEIPFGLWTWVGSGKHVLDGGMRSAHWRNLANTTEPSMCGSDAAFCLAGRNCISIIIVIIHRHCNTTLVSITSDKSENKAM